MKRPYDSELGKITDQDREYAADLLGDLADDAPTDLALRMEITASWLRKVRYEAVMADRKMRAVGETIDGSKK